MAVKIDATELVQASIDSLTHHAIIVTNDDGLIRVWNTGAARIFQHTDAEMIVQDIRVLFCADDVVHGVPEKEMARASREVCTGDFRWHLRKDGTIFWAEGMNYPVRSRAGEQAG